MTQNFKSKLIASLVIGGSAIALSACSTHHDSSSRYGGASASAECYSECGFYWANRVIAIPTTHTIETKYVEQPAKIEYVDREVIKEVIVEKEVPVQMPCPETENCYPTPTTPWTPPPVLRK